MSRSIGQLARRLRRQFARHGVPDPSASARYLLAHCIGERTLKSRHSGLRLSESQLDLLSSMCQRRIQREPLQYILGNWDFRDVHLEMRRPVFIPRPETEKLVDLAKACALDFQANSSRSRRRHGASLQGPPDCFYEVGTGSGAVTACLLRELPQSCCLAIEILPEACDLTLANCTRLGVADRLHLVNASVATPRLLGGAASWPAQLVVSNPPYVPESGMSCLQPEVANWESPLALRGGGGDGEGLAVIRQLMAFADAKLLAGGWLVFEIDSSQGDSFRRGHVACGSLQFVSVEADFAGRDRFCLFQKL